MTAPNHIIGGIAITGISLSFFDINIFSNSLYLSTCIFSSLLPDIDHTKSMVGKLFYPLAKYLDKKHGHRTITHSLTLLLPLFIFFCFFELNIINPIYSYSGLNFSLIFFFAFLSHLILDMLTVQGIPLFYPFLKNPCVIPANPTMRFRSGNIKSEAIALFLFTFVLFSSYDLFENGFWTTYNRSFGTIKHAYREFRDSNNFVGADFNYLFNGEETKGKGIIIEAVEDKIELLKIDSLSSSIIVIDKKDNRFKKIEIVPFKTDIVYKVLDYEFYNISLKKLNDTLKNKIVSGQILSTYKFRINNNEALRGSMKLQKEISPHIYWIKNDTIKKDVLKKLLIKKSKLREIQSDNFREKQKLSNLKKDLEKYKLSLKRAKSIYLKNKFETLVLSQKKKINNFNLSVKNTSSLSKEISILKSEMEYSEINYFTANLKVYVLPEKNKIISYF